MTTDQLVLDQLHRRWRGRTDITTIAQAQAALTLPPNTAQRLRLHDALTNNPKLWQPIKKFGATPLTVTLTEPEKRLAHRLLAGSPFDKAATDTRLDSDDARTAKRVLTHTGLLHRGRLALHLRESGHSRLGGLGLQAHTIRVEGEPAFNVP